MGFTATCNECGFVGNQYTLGNHSCSHEEYLREAGNNGRCEDYPACGHTDGNSCSTEATGTMDFWSDMYSRFGDDVDFMEFDNFA